MSLDPDTTRIVRTWLDEGVTELPDRVLDSVIDQLPATQQRRATWWPAQRRSAMSASLALAAAAVIIIAALIGISYYRGSNVGGPGIDSSSPSPDASRVEPSATPSDGALRSADPLGDLPLGPFVLTDGENNGMVNVPTTLTIPGPGWYGRPGNGILMSAPEDRDFGPDDAGMIGPFTGEIYVPADPCAWTTTMPPRPAATVDEVVAALQAQASRTAAEPVDIAVDGRDGKSITLHVPEDVTLDECDRGRYCTLTQDDPEVCHRWQQFNGQFDEVWVVEVEGVVAVIAAMWGSETSVEEMAQLRAILHSMTFQAP